MALRPRINEFVFNHVGVDTNEYIEILADASVDLSSYKLIIIDGDANQSGVIDNVISLGTTNAAGYYVTPYFNNQLQNGTQTLLLVQNYTGPTSGDLDTNNDGILESTPWAAVIDSLAVRDTTDVNDRTYLGAPTFAPVGGGAIGGASRIPDGIDTDSTSDFIVNDFDGAGLPGFTGTPVAGEALNTPGAVNQAVGGTGGGTTTATVRIREIQGAQHTSPLVGQTVRTSGIVTAIARAGSLGYYIQDPSPDADVRTSEAVFVFTNSLTGLPAIGDAVTVTGRVNEYNNGSANNLTVTELTGPTTVVNSSNNPLPAAIVIGQGGRTPPTGAVYNDGPGNLNAGFGDFDVVNEGIDFFESLEGMRVTVNNAVVVQGTNGFTETWVLADNGAGSTVRTPRGGILAQQTDDNPERIQFDNENATSQGAAYTSKVGDTIGSVSGVLNYDFGNFRIDLTSAPVIVDGGLRQEVTSLHGDADTLTFAEWNVENLDPSDPKFAAIAAIIGTNLARPDVIALQEIQDSNGATDNGVTDATLTAAKLIAAVQAATGITYFYADIAPANDTSGGEPGGNIRPGFLYNPARVQLGALSALADTDLSDGNAYASSRIPLLGTFRFNNQDVSLIDVHYSSKSGGGSSYGAVQPPVNGAEAARIAQAIETKKVIDARLAANPDAMIAVLGDHNEFSYNASQQVFTSDGSLTDLEALQPVNERYTYTFDGQSQALDHTLASGALLNVADFDTVHVNSEFADAARVSDHDPSVTALYLPDLGLAPMAFQAGAIDPAATRTVVAQAGQAVSGGAGEDIILGAAGTAQVAGGAGADLFAFINGSGGGVITVADFVVGTDHLTLQNFATGAADTVYAARVVSAGATTLTLPDATRVVLSGVTTLDRASFV